MNLMEMILNAGGGGPGKELARQFGLDDGQATSAIRELAPALARGMQRNSANDSGLNALRDAISSGNHARYLEQPDLLSNPTTRTDGNSILGHLLGSKDVSRNVAGRAAQNTGIDPSILKQMLPIVATLAMGALGKQSGGAGPDLFSALTGSGGRQGGGGAENLLTQFLDADRDGSALDDILGMAKKFF